MVFALSTNCRYCAESTPFYQKLVIQKGGRSDVRFVVITSQGVEEARRYLSEHDISIDEVKHVDLGEKNITGTPTLIEVDATGTVLHQWRGKLPPDKEIEVAQSLFGGS